jgi:hypothetical protein
MRAIRAGAAHLEKKPVMEDLVVVDDGPRADGPHGLVVRNLELERVVEICRPHGEGRRIVPTAGNPAPPPLPGDASFGVAAAEQPAATSKAAKPGPQESPEPMEDSLIDALWIRNMVRPHELDRVRASAPDEALC